MVLWNFDFLWKNYGTMEKNYGTMDKTIVQWKKTMVVYTENYENSIYYGKKHGVFLPKVMEKLW